MPRPLIDDDEDPVLATVATTRARPTAVSATTLEGGGGAVNLIDDEDDAVPSAVGPAAAGAPAEAGFLDNSIGPRPSADEVDAITAEKLHSVRRVFVSSPDGRLTLWYNTSTLIRIAQGKGRWMQPPHFREPMAPNLIKKIEEVEGREIVVQVPLLRMSQDESEIHHVGLAGNYLDDHFILSKKEVYVCPLCFKAASKQVEESENAEHEAMAAAVRASFEANELNEHEKREMLRTLETRFKRRTKRRCPIEVLSAMDEGTVLPFVAFANAALWKAHFKNAHGTSDDEATDYKLREFINDYIAALNRQHDAKLDFGRVHNTTQGYWFADARFNVMRYNRIRDIVEGRQNDPEVKRKCVFDVDVAYDAESASEFEVGDDEDDGEGAPVSVILADATDSDASEGDESDDSDASSHGDLIRHLELQNKRKKAERRRRKEQAGRGRKAHRSEGRSTAAAPSSGSSKSSLSTGDDDDNVDDDANDDAASSTDDSSSGEVGGSDDAESPAESPVHPSHRLGVSWDSERRRQLTPYERLRLARLEADAAFSEPTAIRDRTMRQTTLNFTVGKRRTDAGAVGRAAQEKDAADDDDEECEEDEEDFGEKSMAGYSKDIVAAVAKREASALNAVPQRGAASSDKAPTVAVQRSKRGAKPAPPKSVVRNQQPQAAESAEDLAVLLRGETPEAKAKAAKPTVLLDDD
jgi:hypothetical protein